MFGIMLLIVATNNQTIADDRGRCGIDNETFYSDDVFDDEFSNKLFIL